MPTDRPSRMRVAWTAGRLAGRRLLRRSVGSQDLALGEQLTAQLDQMKGLAMKIGQIVSYMDVPLPDAVQAQLSQLQTGQEGMPFEQVRERVEHGLGRSLEDAFESFDPKPIAAASIGQVHRAQVTGKPVAVKVQYPDIAASFRDDLRSIGRLASLASLASAVDGTAIVQELGNRLTEECDYVREARMQRAFARAFADDPTVQIPEVLHTHSTETVLTSQWIDGDDFGALEHASPEHRQAVAATLVRFSYRSLWQLGTIQADPHPGNFIFPCDGPVAFLDFGCVRRLPLASVEASRALFTAIGENNRPRCAEAAAAMGMVGRPKKFDFDHFFTMMEHMYRPLLRPEFEFSPSYVREAMEFNGPTNPNARNLAIPPEFIWVSRLQWGLWAILGRLEVRGRFSAIPEQILSEPIAPLADL